MEYIYIRDFRSKKIVRDKEEHYIMTKMSIFQEDITILSIYIYTKDKASQYTRQQPSELKEKKIFL